MTTLPMGPLMAARARAKGGDVDVRRVGAATVLLLPSPASELDDRTFDVDPRAPDDIGEILELVRRAGRRPLLEIDQLLMGDEERASLAARGLVRRWNVAELRKDLSTAELSSAKSITVRDVRADEAEAFGALAEAAFGEPPPGLPPIVPGELPSSSVRALPAWKYGAPACMLSTDGMLKPAPWVLPHPPRQRLGPGHCHIPKALWRLQ